MEMIDLNPIKTYDQADKLVSDQIDESYKRYKRIWIKRMTREDMTNLLERVRDYVCERDKDKNDFHRHIDTTECDWDVWGLWVYFSVRCEDFQNSTPYSWIEKWCIYSDGSIVANGEAYDNFDDFRQRFT